MKRRAFITLLGGAAVAWPLAARAQQNLASIGFLGAGAVETSAPLLEAVKQGLRENGLLEGKDYVLKPRWAEGHYERFAEYARELVEQDVRVIIVTTIAAARAAQRATSAIPIVMASRNDPVGNGIVASLARPGGNTTGMATLNQDVTTKLLEFTNALFPNAASIAVSFNPTNPSNPVYFENVRVQAVSHGIAVQDFAVNTPSELDSRFDTTRQNDPMRCW
jgi:putative ABC transport system substrate-binding protein